MTKALIRLAIMIVLFAAVEHKDRSGPTWEYVITVIATCALSLVEAIM